MKRVLDAVADLADRRIQAVDRDQADRRILGSVSVGGDVALARVHGKFHADLGALVEGADREVRVEDLDVVDGGDVAGGDLARPRLLQNHPLRAVALHLDGDVLDIEHEIRDVLADTGDRGKLMQHAIDMHGDDRGALQRGEQNAAQRVAERQAEAALQRLRHDRREALAVITRDDFELVRLDQFLPVLLDHEMHLSNDADAAAGCHGVGRIGATRTPACGLRRDGACAGGSRCAGSASRRGSRSR